MTTERGRNKRVADDDGERLWTHASLSAARCATTAVHRRTGTPESVSTTRSLAVWPCQRRTHRRFATVIPEPNICARQAGKQRGQRMRTPYPISKLSMSSRRPHNRVGNRQDGLGQIRGMRSCCDPRLEDGHSRWTPLMAHRPRVPKVRPLSRDRAARWVCRFLDECVAQPVWRSSSASATRVRRPSTPRCWFVGCNFIAEWPLGQPRELNNLKEG